MVAGWYGGGECKSKVSEQGCLKPAGVPCLRGFSVWLHRWYATQIARVIAMSAKSRDGCDASGWRVPVRQRTPMSFVLRGRLGLPACLPGTYLPLAPHPSSTHRFPSSSDKAPTVRRFAPLSRIPSPQVRDYTCIVALKQPYLCFEFIITSTRLLPRSPKSLPSCSNLSRPSVLLAR